MYDIESRTTDPYENLALEEYVFLKLQKGGSCLMLWQNDKSVIVGRFQNAAQEVNGAYAEEKGIVIARRLSGGGAVYHDLGNLNYTFIADSGDAADDNYRVFVQPLIRTLARFGIEAECTGRNDLTIGGAKFSGHAQYGRQGRVLHHGCIMLSTDLEELARVLRVRPAKFTGKGIASVRSRVTSVSRAAGRDIPVEEFREALREEVFRDRERRPYALEAPDWAAIQKLRDEKYASWEWNFGKSPAYEMEREGRFAGGLISVSLSVTDGRIRALAIRGDFFGDGDIEELEQALIGSRTDETLADRLEELQASHYVRGVSAAELASLMR